MLKWTHILIRFGELNTKGKNKKQFINLLLHNIKDKLKSYEKLKYIKEHDRLFIEINDHDINELKERLLEVFGLSSFSFAKLYDLDLDLINNEILDLFKENETFKIITKRQDKNFKLNSDAVNRYVASYILKHSKHKVDVKNPDLKIYLEIRQHNIFLLTDKIKGLNGLPVGISGKALMMISGGIDSPVAAYLLMKRGLELNMIHFESSPYTSLEAINKVKDLIRVLSKYQIKINLHLIPFTKMQLLINKHCDESYNITIIRRMMFRIADKLAKNLNILALASGESIGQVASQTLESAYVINKVSDLIVYRPLATYDKEEIVDLSKKINTFEISIKPFEDCCTIFNPKNPVTKPKLKRCLELEERFDYQMIIDECLAKMSTITITSEENKIQL